MKILKYPDKEVWNYLLQRQINVNRNGNGSLLLTSIICDVLKEIQRDGDKAIIEFAKKYDNIDLENFSVSKTELNKATSNVNPGLKKAINIAREKIELFHKHQICETKIIETSPGVKCWQKSVPIEKIGIYIPGDDIPLFSSVLMHVIPAKLAGCKEIVICTPPDKKGKICPKILYTANLLGVTKIFKIGGIQAIGAMAFGTKTVPKVDKIFGYGNKFVDVAKQLVLFMDVAIDMPSGPSELAVITNNTSNPAYIAADILSHTEYDENSEVLIVTDYEPIIEKINIEINNQIKKLPRRKIAIKSLSKSKIILLRNQDEVIDFINSYAPESLIISTDNYKNLVDRIYNAGSVFLGHFSPVSAGCYATGPNHTLPTKGSAKVFSGLNIDSFIKKLTFQELTKEGLNNISNIVSAMADAENLFGHKNAVNIRLCQPANEICKIKKLSLITSNN